MTEYTCQKIICQNTELANDLLRLGKSQSLANTKSVRTKIAEGTKTQCKKWVNTAEYTKGDLVALENNLFIAAKDNNNKDPRVYRDNWTLVLLPYNGPQAKVKAFLVARQNENYSVDILKSYNIDSVSAKHNFSNFAGLDITFTNGMEANQGLVTLNGYIESATSNEEFIIKTKREGIDFISIEARPLESDGDEGNLMSTTIVPIFTIVVYSQGTSITPLP